MCPRDSFNTISMYVCVCVYLYVYVYVYAYVYVYVCVYVFVYECVYVGKKGFCNGFVLEHHMLLCDLCACIYCLFVRMTSMYVKQIFTCNVYR